ncbi:MAG: bifunctional nicotinamidase/pyrazinamidase [Hyphomicrobiales bacterium]
MSGKALLMIDIQNDFCSGGALAVADGDATATLSNALQDKFDIRVLTQDWHPADHSSFADNHQGAEPFSMIEMPYGPQVLWPTHCVTGSEGAAFHKDLVTDTADMVIRKGFRSNIDSYSAFYENDKTTETGLAGYLRERGATQVYLTGIATDFCVCYSAIDAVKQGFEATVIMDACRAIDMDGSLAQAMQDMTAVGISFITSDAI